MGVSFKISQKGKRFHPKPFINQAGSTVLDDDESKDGSRVVLKNESSLARKLEGEETERNGNVNGVTGSSLGRLIPENGVSFTLNLFQDGYSIGKPSEIEPTHPSTLQDNSKLLPYDRKSENLFSAIECGRLPGDILDDIPCKYFDGTIVCEVRDFRGRPPEQGPGAQSTDGLPIVNKIHLRMSLENVVKDIPLISDNSWTYGDLMEVESRILKALQPQLNLNPAPTFDRLCNSPVPMKLNFSQYSERRKRLRQLSEVSISSNSRYGKKICIDRVPENFNTRLGDSGAVSGNLNAHDNVAGQNMILNEMMASRPKNFTSDATLPAQSAVAVPQSRYSMGSGTPRGMIDQAAGTVLNPSGVSPSGQEMMSYVDNLNPNVSLHAKRETQDGQMSPLSSFNKRPRPSLMGIDGIQQHPLASMESPQGSDMNWKNMLQQQAIARGMQYSNAGVQKFSPQMFEGVLNQDSVQIPFATGQSTMRYGAKEEQFDSEKMDGSDISRNKTDMQMMETENHLDPQHPRVQQRPPQQAFMRSNLSQPPWNNFGQHIEKEARKEDQLSKRKSVQSPHVSAGAMAQPSLSKSGEFSSGGSGGPHYGVPGNISALASAQKDKPGINPVSHVGGTPSLTSSANDSMQRQHQAQAAAKRRSNSLPKTPVISGVGSPASVGNMSVPLNANSPSVGTPPFADQSMIERFSKIEMVTARHQLNLKKSKANDYPIRKSSTYSAHNLATLLANSSINDGLKDDAGPRKMSKSLIGGSLNACKRRVLTFMLQDRTPQGMDSYVTRLRSRVILSEKPNDGTVAITYEDIDDSVFLAIEDCLPTLPNTLLADLLAGQLSSLMVHEGYDLIEDVIQLRPTRINPSANNQSNAAGHPHINPAAEMQNYGEAFPSQTSNEVPKPSGSGNASLLNASHSLLGNARMLPPGNPQAMQMSQGILAGVSLPARPQQVEAQASMQQQQQQQQQQPQPSQQQNQQSLAQPQHQQFQRQVMLGTNTLSHLNAIGQNPNVQLGTNMVNKSSIPLHLLQQQQQQQQQQSQMQRKMMIGAVGMGSMNNNMMGLGSLGSSIGVGATRGIGGTGLQAPMGSIPTMGNAGQNPMNLTQASSFNNALNQQFRAGTLTPAQAQAYKFRMAQNRGMLGAASQSAITGIPGARQMHPSSGGLSMLGQTLNRASLTPMQRAVAVVSPQQVGSPSTMGVQQLNQQQQQQQQQQTASPQQMNQRTPMSPQQMSSGTIHALSAGNPEVCPASPQLSSQTLGSVSSIANSPMDMQGVNKSNSVNNS
ncbi:histone-lysine N-methyltransferase 2D isoform X1 [Cucumis melo var. makuwa]|uniref:Histone-lysine N-methyltransferase 2D isoform X1 n=1 Tax=Cucumis melo var. makuwa TaxID=1194695 RepID=A0A5D3C0H1_CUCMM|nr:histone-lysine N-methyltransferase 2D isoform X1 [Cucumis melo var. makuwa]